MEVPFATCDKGKASMCCLGMGKEPIENERLLLMILMMGTASQLIHGGLKMAYYLL